MDETRFLVVSFQKRLVEQVIDTWKSGKSLLRLENFRPAVQARQEARKSVLFCVGRILGKGHRQTRPTIGMCGWSLI